MAVKRALSPSTNAPGLMSAAAAIWAAVVMIAHAVHHQGVIDPQVIVSALGAAAALYTRFVVTPVADPKDGNGKPLAAPKWPADIGREIIDAIQVYERGMGVTQVQVPSAQHDPMQRP